MDFSRVTAMSIGGHSVSSVWLNGVKVWPTTTTYYFPFRLVRNGSYLTWSQFQSESWSIELYNEDITNSITFNQNDVGHLADGNGRTVFYLSTTNQNYVCPVLTTSDWEHAYGSPITPATTNTLAAFNSVGIVNIDGAYVGVEPEEDNIIIVITDGTFVCYEYTQMTRLYWEVYTELDGGHITLATEAPGIYNSYVNTPVYWGSSYTYNEWVVPSSLWGQTITINYTLGVDNIRSFYGSVQQYIPAPSQGGSEYIYVSMPNIVGVL